MAHIADFMVDASNTLGLNNYIARELSPHSAHDAATDTASEEKDKYVWRMHQPSEPRRYQLFPAMDKLAMTLGRKSPDPESALSVVTDKERLQTAGNALRKPKEQTLVRRRKVSVPELGPMTTVQEVAMDSPTIPGRPPLHERSISAPGNTWRQHMFGESMLSCISGPALDEQAEMALPDDVTQQTVTPATSNEGSFAITSGSTSPKLPLSPKSLSPLVIPTSQPRLPHQSSNSRLRNEFSPEVPPKSSKPKENSPYSRASPYTPMSSTLSLPLMSATTPHSAPEGRSSPKPWTFSTTHSPSPLVNSQGLGEVPLTQSRPGQQPSPKPHGRSRGQSDHHTSQTAPTHHFGHRRGESDGAASIMDRGRPQKRPDAINTSPMKRPVQKRSLTTDEQKAFEHLPNGFRATEANTILPPTEVDALRKQAIGQASRFEVLTSKDVEALSRELRGLDERCEYLRKTHRSLRAGRRNLHERICSYLRSPRVARFSHDSILKQEEALSELDCSIDDWVTKLEQAENRRTRIRQKLLEHVAASLIMEPAPSSSNSNNAALVMALSGENTPPRSPTKREAMSPQQETERVVSEVRVASPEAVGRATKDVQSIRIYADSDVYALLADVEQEITRMGEMSDADNAAERREEEEEEEKKQAEMERKRKEKLAAEVEKKKEDAIDAGITLSAMTFEALPARTYTPPIH